MEDKSLVWIIKSTTLLACKTRLLITINQADSGLTCTVMNLVSSKHLTEFIPLDQLQLVSHGGLNTAKIFMESFCPISM